MIVIPAKSGERTVVNLSEVSISVNQGQKYLTVLFTHADGTFEVRSEERTGLSGVLTAFQAAKKPEFLKGRNYREALRVLANGAFS